jgi:hypothetical protein
MIEQRSNIVCTAHIFLYISTRINAVLARRARHEEERMRILEAEDREWRE